MQLNEKFMRLVPDMDPVTFTGVVKVLGVPVVEKKDDTVSPRDFVDVFSDTVTAFDKKDRKFKRELLSIIKKANKNKEGEA